jgi:DNA-directed RNA polymerase specialized sigma24 family protein
MPENHLDELARRALAGDSAAEAELHAAASEYFGTYFQRVSKNGSSADVPERLVKEALARVVQSLRNFNPAREAVADLLMRAAQTTCRDHARAARKRELSATADPALVQKMAEDMESLPLTPELEQWLRQQESSDEEIAAGIREAAKTGKPGIDDVIQEFEQKLGGP